MSGFRLGLDSLDVPTLMALVQKDREIRLLDEALDQVKRYRDGVEETLRSGRVVYGINTGFGFMAEVRIPPADLNNLQKNLIRSHACAVGTPISDELVRALLLIRAHTFALGPSGIRCETLELILEFLRREIYPLIPEKGSVGASGDLAPLAHLALGLMGEGSVRYQGQVMPAQEVVDKMGLKPLEPAPKEGLSLINGTHFMTALAAFCIHESKILLQSADAVVALTLGASRGTLRAFDPRIHECRPHPGQAMVSRNVLKLVHPRDPIHLSHRECGKVQDAYSLRCVPQVHGASRDAFSYAEQVVNRELNSVTDNPICLADGDLISGGNFHGQPVALSMDFLAMAMAEIGSISERRIEKLTNPHASGLPAFLIRDGGLQSGFMIPHVVAAALASENKTLCHPASVDSIPTSADREDHVSMGPIAARKCREILKNVSQILAIELLGACQGLDLLAPLKPHSPLKEIWEGVREMSPPLDKDRALGQDIEKVGAFILQGGLLQLLAGEGVHLE